MIPDCPACRTAGARGATVERFLQTMVFGVVLLSLLVRRLTEGPLPRWLGLVVRGQGRIECELRHAGLAALGAAAIAGLILAHPIAAFEGSVEVALVCQHTPQRVTVRNFTDSPIRVVMIENLARTRPRVRFPRDDVLAPGDLAFYEAGINAGTRTALSHDLLFDADAPDDGVHVATTVGTIEVLCRAGIGSIGTPRSPTPSPAPTTHVPTSTATTTPVASATPLPTATRAAARTPTPNRPRFEGPGTSAPTTNVDRPSAEPSATGPPKLQIGDLTRFLPIVIGTLIFSAIVGTLSRRGR